MYEQITCKSLLSNSISYLISCCKINGDDNIYYYSDKFRSTAI